jgi:endo-1,4-beta-xylanase
MSATVLPVFAQTSVGLRNLPGARVLPIGSELNGTFLENLPAGSKYASTAIHEFNITGCENELKMYSFTGWKGDPFTGTPIIDNGGADAVANLARANHMVMRGHVLIYNQAIPRWISPDGVNTKYTDAQLQAMVKKYIFTRMQRYADVVKYWDVTNECFDEKGELKHDFWYTHLGGDNYIANIFRWAHEADPQAQLYYNDYSTEHPGPKFNGMLAYLVALKNKGVPIDGIGFQCHENTKWPQGVLSTANTNAVDAAGFKWQVTELDCGTDAVNPNWKLQAKIYAETAKICLADSNCQGLFMWGYTDKHSWLRPPNGLPFDAEYAPKPCYWALYKAFENPPPRTSPVATAN